MIGGPGWTTQVTGVPLANTMSKTDRRASFPIGQDPRVSSGKNARVPYAPTLAEAVPLQDFNLELPGKSVKRLW
jgi:hypothetical protein